MPTTQSLAGIAATFIYLIICGFCLRAAAVTRRTGRPSWEAAWWSAFAVLFVALMILRIGGIEEYWRTILRNLLRKDGVYDLRREAQAPLSVVAILCTATLVALAARLHFRTRPGSALRMLAYARLAVAGLCGLVMLRVISFHPVDMLLYGPAKLNWLIDIGSSLFAGWCAHRFTAIARNPRPRR